MFSLLYIDDEPELLELGQLSLESTGEFTVMTALSGDEGLAYLSRHDFDAVISDYQMPGMDGISLLKNVRKSFGNIPFILFTGRGREEVVIEAINNGVDFYLQKGGDPKSQFAELAHKVRQAVNRRRAETALSDSEKRLADLINFLPDATFAIDTHGVVIAWNRAMERMTGVRSENVLGKGEYEYALPFYHERRPLLINLVLGDDPAIAVKYPFVKKEGKTLFSEITIPQFNDGRGAALWFTASPLYNRNGVVVGAIESIRDITDRKNAEEALRLSEDRYRTLAEISPDAILVHQDGEIVYANPAALSLVGASRFTDIAGKPLMDLIHPDSRDLIRSNIQSDARGERTPAVEVRMRRFDGQSVTVEGSGVLTTHEGRPAIQVAIRDITERKRSEEELRAANEQLAAAGEELKAQYDELAKSEERIRESESRFKTLFERSAEAQLLLDFTGKVTDCNTAFLTLFALPGIEEIRGHSPEDFAPEFQPDGIRSSTRGDDILAMVVKDGAVRYEWEHLKHDPARTPILTDVICTLIVVAGWPMIHVSIRDITDRKLAETELRAAYEQLTASEEELRQQYGELAAAQAELQVANIVVENSPVMLFRWEAKEGWPVAYASQNVVRLGYTQEEFTSGAVPFATIVHPDDIKRVAEEVRRYSSEGPGQYQQEFRIITRKGDVRWVDDRTVIECDDAGVITHYQGILIDITERRQAEDALRESEAKFRGVIEQSFQFIGLMKTDGTLIVVNRSALAFAGLSESDVIGRPFWETPWWTHSKELQEKLKEAIARAASGETVRFEATHQDAEGHLADIDFSLKPVVDPAGKILYLIPEGRDIAERKMAENALMGREQDYRGVIENLQDVFYRADIQGNITMASQSVVDVFGYASIDEVIGLNLGRDIYTNPDDRNRFLDAISPTGSVKNFEAVLKKKDGTPVIVSTSAHYYRDKDGVVLGVEGIAKDITEWKHAQLALRDSEEKYRMLVEQSRDGVFIIQDDRLVFFNRALTGLSGYTPEELDGKLLADLITPEDREMVVSRARDRAGGKQVPEEYEFSLVHKDGVSRTRVRVRAGRGTYKGRRASIGTFYDITKDRKREDALRESEEKYRALVETTGDFIWEINAEGVYTYVSPQVRRILGYGPEELLGKTPFDIMPTGEAEQVAAEFRRSVEARLPIVALENKAVRKDGTVVILETSGVVRLAKDGSYQGYRGIDRDITVRKLAEAAIREANRKLNLLNSITRHDIRNQLMIAQGYTQLAALNKPDPVVADFLTKISTAFQTIQHQIEFTRTYQDLGGQTPTWFRIGDVVRNARPEEIKLVCTCKTYEIFADPMIGKVFFNLFDNAMKYGERVTTVRVGCKKKGKQLVIRFADNGIGVPPQEKKKIFDKGYGKHTGFGLFLAQEILAITGITIQESGTYGKGAVFEIIVPKGAYRPVD